MNKKIYSVKIYPNTYGILETPMFPNKYYFGLFKEDFDANGKLLDYTPLNNSIPNFTNKLSTAIDLLIDLIKTKEYITIRIDESLKNFA